MLEAGDAVLLTCGDRSVEATVTLVGGGGVTLFLVLREPLGDLSGSVGLVRGDDGVFRELVSGTEVNVSAL